MVNFIIYEKCEKIRTNYEMVILNFIGVREEKFKIFCYDEYKNKSSSRDIYILSSDDIKETLCIAQEIRNKDNWNSQIIVISNLRSIKINMLINRLLILDYINKKSKINDRLKEALYDAYKILTKHKVLTFHFNSEIIKIPYRNILYIEKSNNRNYCTITTNNNKYIIKDTITNLEKKLDSAYFMKTHRSCIVNLFNIDYYNSSENIIRFKNNKKTDLIAREKKQILKSRLINERITK